MKTLEERYTDARRAARKACEQTGRHQWDRWMGSLESGGGGFKVVSGIGCMDGPVEVEDPYWSHYVRKCTLCGKRETTHDNRVWKAEAGQGHFECDPITGEKRFVEKNTR